MNQLNPTAGISFPSRSETQKKKSQKHWGPQRNGGREMVSVVPIESHPYRIKIAKVCFWGGFWEGGVG